MDDLHDALLVGLGLRLGSHHEEHPDPTAVAPLTTEQSRPAVDSGDAVGQAAAVGPASDQPAAPSRPALERIALAATRGRAAFSTRMAAGADPSKPSVSRSEGEGAGTASSTEHAASTEGVAATVADAVTDAEVEVPPPRGSDLLADFQPGEGGVLGAAVDRFLDELESLADRLSTSAGVSGPEEATGLVALASWPTAATAVLVGMEAGRRWLRREEREANGSVRGASSRPAGARGPLSGWPGSWSWSAGARPS